MSSILILGLPKSGTSALYSAVKQQGSFLSVYEPGNERQIDYVRRSTAPNKVVKILYPRPWLQHVDLSFFGKKILITRDPRDILVSWLLYRPFQQRNYANRAFIDAFLAALRRKERHPVTTSTRSIYAVLDDHGIAYTRHRDYRHQFAARRELQERYGDLFVFKYEDFVDGNLSALSEHVALPLSSKTRLGEHVSYNERSKSYGNWRHWFNEEDVGVYRATFQPEIEALGYDPEWRLADCPVIDPATSSEYVVRNLDRVRRYPRRYGELRPADHYVPEYLDVLRSAVDDGTEGAMVELALAYKRGYGVTPDLRRSIMLLDDAAERGNAVAMVHLGLAHEYGVGVERDTARAKDYYRRAGAIRGGMKTTLLTHEHRREWRH